MVLTQGEACQPGYSAESIPLDMRIVVTRFVQYKRRSTARDEYLIRKRIPIRTSVSNILQCNG